MNQQLPITATGAFSISGRVANSGGEDWTLVNAFTELRDKQADVLLLSVKWLGPAEGTLANVQNCDLARVPPGSKTDLPKIYFYVSHLIHCRSILIAHPSLLRHTA